MNPAKRNHPFLFACLMELLLLVLGIGLALVLRVPFLELLSWDFYRVLIGVAGTVPLLVVLTWLIKTSWSPVIRIRCFIDEVVRPLLGQCSVPQLLVLSILAGVGEEFFFRAFLQTWFSAMLGPLAGLVLASLIFGACHLATRFYGFFATTFGLYLGLLMLVTGNIWPSAIAHTLYDFIALVWLLKVRKST